MRKEPRPTLHPRNIDKSALQIVEKLQNGGFTTFLVGGCVRDLLIGIVPKDYDIATDAKPPQVKKLIRYAFIIGKRFRLVLVRRGDQQFEVATFRRNIRPEDIVEEEMPTGDNFFGTPEEDAQRRDFTINSMFYNPANGELIDYCNGMRDIKAGQLQIIGDPDVRLDEDAIRILRALRLAHKTGFSIATELKISMQKNAGLLQAAILPRKREEYLKLLRLKEPEKAFLEAHDLNILQNTLPTLDEIFRDEEKAERFLSRLKDIPYWLPKKAEPADIFGHLVICYFKALYGDKEVPSKKELVEDEKLFKLMNDELGMFKAEQSLVLRALRTVGLIVDIEKFRRRGQRRKLAFLYNDAFPLALNFARAEYLLSASDLHFWHNEYQKSLTEPRPQPEREGPRK